MEGSNTYLYINEKTRPMNVYFIPSSDKDMEAFEREMKNQLPDLLYDWNHKTLQYEFDTTEDDYSTIISDIEFLIDSCGISGDIHRDSTRDDYDDMVIDEMKFDRL